MNDTSTKLLAAAVAALFATALAPAGEKAPRLVNGKTIGLANELIDVEGFAKAAAEAQVHRATRRITEEEFISMAADKDTVVLDSRSARKFAMLHVKGAVNLNFSDMTTDTLAAAIPSKATRILIYCNNNFDKEAKAFPSKAPSMALNIPTFITLYAYGYKNIYELGPLLDIRKTKIALQGMRFAKN